MDNGISLYIHIPFCLSRCNYCTFVSGGYDATLADAYIASIAKELQQRTVFSRQRPHSLFIGGGTPSCLSLRQLEYLFSFLPMPESGGEATCELNPDSVDGEKLRLLRQCGITRCSFGVQTFSERGLHLLGRRHDAATALRAVNMALETGFTSVSLDLIMGWPGQEVAELEADLRRAAALGVRHLSCYNLLLEPGSALATIMQEQGLAEKDEEEGRLFWDTAETVLAESGLQHYETSNYAKPGWQCRHNVHIWQGGEYLGLGAAAHSFLNGRRSANNGDREGYIAAIREGKSAEVFSETLRPEERARECAVFWLRLFEGVELAVFRKRTGWDFMELYAETAPGLLERGFLALDAKGERVFVPREWHPVLDALLPELV